MWLLGVAQRPTQEKKITSNQLSFDPLPYEHLMTFELEVHIEDRETQVELRSTGGFVQIPLHKRPSDNVSVSLVWA